MGKRMAAAMAKGPRGEKGLRPDETAVMATKAAPSDRAAFETSEKAGELSRHKCSISKKRRSPNRKG
jgi:hypothetical protein